MESHIHFLVLIYSVCVLLLIQTRLARCIGYNVVLLTRYSTLESLFVAKGDPCYDVVWHEFWASLAKACQLCQLKQKYRPHGRIGIKVYALKSLCSKYSVLLGHFSPMSHFTSIHEL